MIALPVDRTGLWSVIMSLLAEPLLPSVSGSYAPKTPSAFFEQRRHLERARTGDILKTKIQRRPDREALVQQHILEDTRIAPSLHDRQRKLKRAKLADYLNDKIAHRPGPLELVQENILRLSSNDSETATNPVIDGSISFRKTCEGETGRPTGPNRDLDEEDGSSSASSPTSTLANLKDLQVTSPTSVNGIPSTPGSLESLSKAPSPASVVVPSSSCPSPQQSFVAASNLIQQPTSSSLLAQRRRSSAEGDTSAAALVCSQGHPGTNVASSPGIASVASLPTATNSSQQRRNSSKKCRAKPPVPQKTRTIKFHEYKGPPVQNKNTSKPAVADESAKANTSATESETAYRLLLKQQQLFLQWELEAQQKRGTVDHKEAVVTNNNSVSQVLTTQPQQQAIKIENEPQPVMHHAILRNVETSRPSQAQHVTVAFPIQNPIPVPPPSSNLVIRTVTPNPDILQPPTPAPSLEEVKPEKSVEEKPKKPFKLDDLKVSDLKAELKKRSLPVSGAKPQLLERLKNYLNANPDDQINGNLTPPNSNAESPPEIKTEEPTERTVTEASATKPFELPSLTSLRPGQQVSFLQLDPVQQQQATAIALQTLALQLPNGVLKPTTVSAPLVPQIQNLQISAIPSTVPMDVDQPMPVPQQARAQPTVLNTLPTIFLATSQPTHSSQMSGLTFQSTPLQVQQNAMPYIITMNGLNSTLNLINGFNLNAVIDSQKAQQNAQPVPQQPAPVPAPPPPVQSTSTTGELEPTSMQKLQQHLQQKLLMQMQQKQEKKVLENSPVATSNCSGDRFPMQNGYALGGAAYDEENSGMCVDSVMTDESMAQNGANVEEDDGKRHLMLGNNPSATKVESAGNCFAPHCSFPPSTTDCIKSEAIDDVLEILIRNGELPPSAAQDALPKSVILQHSPKPPQSAKNPMVSASNNYYDRRLSNPSSTSFLYSDQPSPPSNTFPLPPISSISPANHGSPVSQHNNSADTADLNAIQQQLALLEYLNNQQQQQSMAHDHHDVSQVPMNPSMDYSTDAAMYYNNAFNDTSNSGHNNHLAGNQSMNDDDISALLDSWLAGNGGFLGNSAGMDMGHMGDRSALSVSPFRHEEMQADTPSFHDVTAGHSAMDESFLGTNADSMFDMFFGDLSAHPTSVAGNPTGGYLAGINTIAGQNVGASMFWPESEQML
ncbi:myocardin-related transcription factor A-like isoform X2 [Paramacrobiotus metropolitanus]|uniref:myocardin-related transcription factor A-like isoform X2 n=1 Tax=Paramacrobiotus metropolitanus TaxID=2943436 RepID=UPI002445AB35|nr:myocardin-related transcription factor A-like isoform X2 [Paramacrobiotus metropolitanus]